MNVKILLVTMGVAALTACSEKDLYDEQAYEQQQKATYAENFAKKYPNVSLNQSWDFSTGQYEYSLPATRSLGTRAGYSPITGDWYEVPNNVLSWMHGELVEGEDNRPKGYPFTLKVPQSGEFTIIPIYQGVAGAYWNLHMVIGGEDITVWNKINANNAQGGTMQIQCQNNPEWHDLHGDYNSQYNTSGTDKGDPVTAVRALRYTFTGLPAGEEVYFYLEVTESGNWSWEGKDYDVNAAGDKQYSYNGMMLALKDCPQDNLGIPDGCEAMLISCEDAARKDSDYDMNDLVFMVYGDPLPEVVQVEEVEESFTKRYMIEDLGATDDFDFNDIVVDVTEIKTKSPVIEADGYWHGGWNYTAQRQEATIRHLGGTLPFVLKIGNTQLEEREGQMGVNPNETFPVTGWIPEKNNISVTVLQKGNEGVQFVNIPFPKAGEVPMIIAVDPSQSWMLERQSIPELWFTVPEE